MSAEEGTGLTRPAVGVSVVVVRDAKVLMGQRQAEHGFGTWAFPGGHIEYGESIEDAARRELDEETGLKYWRSRVIGITSDVFPSGKHYVTIFMGGVNLKKVRPVAREPDKMINWNWYAPNALPEPLFQPVLSWIHQPEMPMVRFLADLYTEAKRYRS